ENHRTQATRPHPVGDPGLALQPAAQKRHDQPEQTQPAGEVKPPSITLTGPTPPGRSVCAPVPKPSPSTGGRASLAEGKPTRPDIGRGDRRGFGYSLVDSFFQSFLEETLMRQWFSRQWAAWRLLAMAACFLGAGAGAFARDKPNPALRTITKPHTN